MKVILYSHGGSGNHGCEALVRSTVKILKNFGEFIVLSNHPEEDSQYQLNSIAVIKKAYSDIKKNTVSYFLFLLKMKLLKSDYYFFKERFRNVEKKTEDAKIALSVGGDNYCYKGYDLELKAINEKLKAKGIKTVLWGCSIEPDVLDHDLVQHLADYEMIVARETITYNALQEKGLDKLKLFPDSAFQLDRVDLDLPPNFKENNTVGINISPLILKHEQQNGIVMQNIIQLINYLLNETDMNIALIPHVVWNSNNDLEPLTEIYSQYAFTNRVVLIADHNAMELKGYIARCRFMIAARTHASIAAYSQHVPTLVLGYSVKAKGIAKDIFGSYENYVLPVQHLASQKEVLNGFKFLLQNEKQILETYSTVMPGYKNRVLDTPSVLENL